MPVTIVIPRESQTMETGFIAKWHVGKGDAVRFGTPLCEVESDKSAFDVESPVDGVVLDILHGEGETVEVLTPIAIVGKPGEKGGKPLLSPKARRAAAEKGLDVGAIVAAGPLTSADVERLAAAVPGAAEDATSRELTGKKRIMADRMHKSLAETAQFTLHRHCDASALLSCRGKVNATGMDKVTLNDLIVFAAARALAESPRLNVLCRDNKIIPVDGVNIGVAVAAGDDLLVPVVKGADAMRLPELSAAIRKLAADCRAHTARPEDLSGGGFTVSNLGPYGIEAFTPILNYPEVAILGVGAIHPRPVRAAGAIEHVDCVSFSLTLNHQAVDGAAGAKFLALLCEKLCAIQSLVG